AMLAEDPSALEPGPVGLRIRARLALGASGTFFESQDGVAPSHEAERDDHGKVASPSHQKLARSSKRSGARPSAQAAFEDASGLGALSQRMTPVAASATPAPKTIVATLPRL